MQYYIILFLLLKRVLDISACTFTQETWIQTQLALTPTYYDILFPNSRGAVRGGARGASTSIGI